MFGWLSNLFKKKQTIAEIPKIEIIPRCWTTKKGIIIYSLRCSECGKTSNTTKRATAEKYYICKSCLKEIKNGV